MRQILVQEAESTKPVVRGFGVRPNLQWMNGPASVGRRLARGLCQNQIALVFFITLMFFIFLRGYWAPDEPDFAQCIKEMRMREAWLFPWLNGEIYAEKPIFYYWIMKISAIVSEKISGGVGFLNGISPWSLRIPSVIASTLIIFGLRSWSKRFFDNNLSKLSTIILATTPIWIWQAQFIQIDMVFASLVAWSWMCWISGYALMRNLVSKRNENEYKKWFIISYVSLGLAILAKGPLSLVLSVAVVLTFLVWQKDLKSFRYSLPLCGLSLISFIVLPWYITAGLNGGAQYVYAMIVRQNLARALDAWDHIQPWWRYISYVAIDYFPWSLMVPVAVYGLFKKRKSISGVYAFVVIAWLIPIILLSFSKSKQGKYILMSYPFLSMAIAHEVFALSVKTSKRLQNITAIIFGMLGFIILLIIMTNIVGSKLHYQLELISIPVIVLGLILFIGGFWIACKNNSAENHLYWYNRMALVFSVAIMFVAPWIFVRLDPIKDYKVWNQKTEAILQGRDVYFWGTIRSGVMVYSKRILPVVENSSQLKQLQIGNRLIATKRQWKVGVRGLDKEMIDRHRVVYEQQQGGDGLLILEICD